MKDSTPFIAVATASLTLTSIPPVQLAGLLIGGIGAIVAVLRMIIAGLDWHEKRRANNLALRKYEDEQNAQSANSEEASKKAGSESTDENTVKKEANSLN